MTMFSLLRRKAASPPDSEHDPQGAYLTPARVAEYLEEAHRTRGPEEFLELTLALFEEFGAAAHAILESDAHAGKIAVQPRFVSASWGSLFGDLRPHLQPSSLKLLTKRTMSGRADGSHLTQTLIATRDVRALDSYGLASLLGSARRNPPLGTVICVPAPISSEAGLVLLAYLPRRKGLVEHGLAPLIRTVVAHKTDVAAGAGSSVSKQWLLLEPTHFIATSAEIRRRRPDLNLDNGTPLERTFPTGRVDLEHLERALFLEPNPASVTLDFDAIARGRRGEHHVTLALEITPVRMNATNYAFIARPSTAEGESLEELGDSAILHATMHQIGMFLILDKFGTIHRATESLTDNLGYEPLAVKDLNISALLDEESVQRFNRLRESTLELLHQPGSNTRVPNAERTNIVLRARDGTPREFNLSLTLLRSRIEGEAIPRGFVATITITDSQALLQKELAERLRFIRHDRHSSANAIAALVDEIRRTPNLTRSELDLRLTDIHDEARVWSEITDTHAQLLEAVNSLTPPKAKPEELLLDLSGIVLDQIPRYARFYARHKLRRAEREQLDIRVEERLEGVTAWAHESGRLPLYYALRNLTENAVKYTLPEPDGRRVITTTIGLDPEQPDHVRVEVTNAAQQLDEAELAEVWDYKKRLANSVHDARGTGIGLWSTKLITERAGGRVGAYLHDDGRRVSFYVAFPLIAFSNKNGVRTVVRAVNNGRLQPVHPEDVRTLVRFATTPRGTPPKVLVLDADPDDLNLSVHYFKHVSADVTATHASGEALRALSAGPYDLFLVEPDEQQPEEIETLLRLARRNGATARVLTSTPSAVPERVLVASSAPKAIFKDALTPIVAVNLAYGRRESHEPPRTA